MKPDRKAAPEASPEAADTPDPQEIRSGVHQRLESSSPPCVEPPRASGCEALLPDPEAADPDPSQPSIRSLQAAIQAKSAELAELQHTLEAYASASLAARAALASASGVAKEALRATSVRSPATLSADPAAQSLASPVSTSPVASSPISSSPVASSPISSSPVASSPASASPTLASASPTPASASPTSASPTSASPTSASLGRFNPTSYPELRRVALTTADDEIGDGVRPLSYAPSETESTESLDSGRYRSAEDRRSDPRIPCELRVEFEDDTQFFAGLSLDVSQGGIFIATYRLLPIGTHVGLRFALGRDGAEIRARGQVRWVRETSTSEGRPGIGVAFTEIGPDAVDAIKAFSTVRPPLVFDDEDC